MDDGIDSTREVQVLKEVGLNADQIFQLLMEKEKTRQIELEIVLVEKKRKFSDNTTSDDGVLTEWKKKKLNELSSRALCGDVWINILEFLPGVEGFRMVMLSKQVMRATKHLTRIEFDKRVKSSRLEDFICSSQFKHIQTLNINYTITQPMFNILIRNCENLKTLTVVVPDGFVLGIPNSNCSVKNLRTLQLSTESLNKAYLESLNSYLFNLEDLKLPSFKSKLASDFLNTCTKNIRVLEIDKVNFDLDPKDYLPNLKSLKIRRLICNMKIFLSFFEIKTLTSLNMSLDSLNNDEGFTETNTIIESKLEYLKLNITGMLTDIICKYQFPNLECLSLTPELTMNSATSLGTNSSLANLKTLELFETSIDELKALCSSIYLKKLTSLTVDYEDIRDIVCGLDYITQSESFSNLYNLQFFGNNVNLDLFSSVSKFSKLRLLYLYDPDINSLINLSKSTHFPHLRKLRIYLSEIVPTNFLENIANNESFRKLFYLGICLNDEQVPILVNAKYFKLKNLTIYGKYVTNVGAKILQDHNINFEFDE
ncbi:predicted protein [Naegleria gruberi]|uniref:Predicted protein n=1 Tax=Naegleria gruberi TaxID=5762 RepID=D2VWV1_NAEGR|nr:uncharacterized protein NAEGRDRAFT_52889 [Naegleria gruberi]EFC38688.1 predicted protein [Naegleria gruberi]|eukprot:XP_002671432.1 predicted protein [Naegleria gruberi strain NEG-M]